jgi:hypothetical protein
MIKGKIPAKCYVCGKDLGEYGILCKRHKKSELRKQSSFIVNSKSKS